MPMIAAEHVRPGSVIRVGPVQTRVIESAPSSTFGFLWRLRIPQPVGFRSNEAIVPGVELRTAPEAIRAYLRCRPHLLLEVISCP